MGLGLIKLRGSCTGRGGRGLGASRPALLAQRKDAACACAFILGAAVFRASIRGVGKCHAGRRIQLLRGVVMVILIQRQAGGECVSSMRDLGNLLKN